ncbi:MAG: lipid-A-disaccharide synthase [Desulfobulbaceae bacterium]|nr:lipid-A-disaccharide synthase [Desulfobulbaceae bacterium]
MNANDSPRIMIVAGEASGDLHGANMVRSILAVQPDIQIFGMGGRELKAAGVELLHDAAGLSVVGITEVFGHLGDILAARRILFAQMQKRKPSLLILIDFPDFNLMLAKKAGKLGIPVFYYISPQVWAWRQGRTRKIGRLADRIAVILPFEKEFYRLRGIDVDFVGHPLMDIVTAGMDQDAFRQSLAIGPDKTIIGLLPGSRRREIVSLLPDFLASAKRLCEMTGREYVFVIPRATTVSHRLLEENGVGRYRDQLDIRIVENNRYDMMANCAAAVAASGTVTLELAILGVPTVATYRLSRRSYLLGRLLVKLRWFSLVNLVAGRTVIPELLQDEVNPEKIAGELSAILTDNGKRHAMLQGLEEVRQKLGGPGASRRAAEIALNMVHENE